MTREEQRQILRRLLHTYLKTVDLEGALRLRGEKVLATSVAERVPKLQREVDRLRRDMWRRWHGGAARLDETLRAENARLQATIRDIERDVQTTDRVVRALGIVEDILSLVRRVGV